MKTQIRLVRLFLLAATSATAAAENTFAYRPGLIAFIRLAEKARASAEHAQLDTAALASAKAAAKQSADPQTYPAAIRTLRHAIRALAVPEAKTGVLHLFEFGKW